MAREISITLNPKCLHDTLAFASVQSSEQSLLSIPSLRSFIAPVLLPF